MQVFRNYEQVLKSVLAAFYYNRDDKELIEVLEQVKARLNCEEWEQPIDDADIIVSILCDLYGEYGTSPRYGWFYDSHLIDEFIRIIDEEIEQLKNYITETENIEVKCYKVFVQINFADGDYSNEEYDGVIYHTYDEAKAAKIIAETCYGVERAWVEAVEEGE